MKIAHMFIAFLLVQAYGLNAMRVTRPLYQNYYRLLGVPKNASQKMIQDAYLNKTLVTEDLSMQQVQELGKALRTLSSPALRAQYDAAPESNVVTAQPAAVESKTRYTPEDIRKSLKDPFYEPSWVEQERIKHEESIKQQVDAAAKRRDQWQQEFREQEQRAEQQKQTFNRVAGATAVGGVAGSTAYGTYKLWSGNQPMSTQQNTVNEKTE